MGTARTPSGTRIYVQSVIGASQSLTGISKAKPPVITYNGADPSNGDYMALTDVFGMTEFEDSIVKVSAVNAGANTFEAEDQDSTLYGTFISGSMAPVTYGLEIGDATGFSISGFEQQFAEYNLLRDRITRKVPTTVSGGTLEVPMLWDPTSATAHAVLAAADSAKRLAFKVLFPDGLEMLFYGYIGSSGMPKAGSNNEVMQASVSITMATRPRYILP